ncbi:hypothetical protein FSP39_008176 [Pinctada imbricata]|uniref:Uncharacterized protein n=1 Tax=Pinctada imbricata TaxID=66713 RepID=A0AA89BQ82_PINIB|nr:hypothetical protein FSP39_008176 [Pinctada imbricata]
MEEIPALGASDFPSLSSGKSAKPPPGFGASKSTNRVPPGFNSKSSESSTSLGARPPPGFSSLQSSEDVISGAKSSLSLKTILPVAPDLPLTTDMSNFKFAEPQEFQSRNKALISQIKESIEFDAEKFDRFKQWSGEFRKGSISATDYYEKCEKLVGEEKFVPIFSELIVLLPDIDKQQELLKAYNQIHSRSSPKDFVLGISGKSKAAPWNKQILFQSCPTCRQVLLNVDFLTHIATHSQENEFPSLESQPSKAQGPGMRAWLKAS